MLIWVFTISNTLIEFRALTKREAMCVLARHRATSDGNSCEARRIHSKRRNEDERPLRRGEWEGETARAKRSEARVLRLTPVL